MAWRTALTWKSITSPQYQTRVYQLWSQLYETWYCSIYFMKVMRGCPKCLIYRTICVTSFTSYWLRQDSIKTVVILFWLVRKLLNSVGWKYSPRTGQQGTITAEICTVFPHFPVGWGDRWKLCLAFCICSAWKLEMLECALGSSLKHACFIFCRNV